MARVFFSGARTDSSVRDQLPTGIAGIGPLHFSRMKPRDEGSGAVAGAAYRDQLDAALARIATLEREMRALSDENRSLTARMAVPGGLSRIDTDALPLDARRRVIQRRVRAIRRELRAAFGIRRYAASAIIAVTAAAAFVVMAAESIASWPLAIAILGIGAVARGLLSHWPGFDELEDRRRKLAALKSQLDEVRAAQRAERTLHALPSGSTEHDLDAAIEPG